MRSASGKGNELAASLAAVFGVSVQSFHFPVLLPRLAEFPRGPEADTLLKDLSLLVLTPL